MSKNSPYPNVRAPRRGSTKYEAVHPSGNRKGKYLGSFDTPELAYAAVLRSQARNLESRVNEYRALATAIAGTCPECGNETEIGDGYVVCDPCGFALEIRVRAGKNHQPASRW